MYCEKPIPHATSLAPSTATALPSCLDFYYYYFLKERRIKLLAQSNSLQVNCFHVVCEGNKHHMNTHTRSTQEGILPFTISAPLVPSPPTPPSFSPARQAQLSCVVMSKVILCWLLESNLQTGYIYSCLHCLTISWWMTHPFPPSAEIIKSKIEAEWQPAGSEDPFTPAPATLSCHRRLLHKERWAAKILLCV